MTNCEYYYYGTLIDHSLYNNEMLNAETHKNREEKIPTDVRQSWWWIFVMGILANK